MDIKIAFLIILIMSCVSCSKTDDISGSIDAMNQVDFSIDEVEIVDDTSDFLERPVEGREYRAFLVSITNNTQVKIYGGTSDYSSIFSVKTSDGFIIQAENTSSNAWRKALLVWNAEEIPKGERRKGWIVFSVPISSELASLSFSVNKVNSPLNISPIGVKSIHFPFI